MDSVGEGTKLPAMSESEIEKTFPGLEVGDYTITSPSTPEYNCIAWAAGDIGAWWWPDANNQYYWPDEVPREESLGAFKDLFEKRGYQECETGDYEEGYQKIAIYIGANNKPTHVSRQLSSGIWTSKLGQIEDIEHPFQGLDSPTYGSVAVIMKRFKQF